MTIDVVNAKQEPCEGQINCLAVSDRGSLRTIANDQPGLHGIECISTLVDLGASEGVLPKFQCMDLPSKEIHKSKSRFRYGVAGGQSIANEGERDVIPMTRERGFCNMSLQVAEVNKGLGSVADRINQGFKVAFDQKRSHTQSPTGEKAGR